MIDKLKTKEEILDILPSVEDCKLFSKSMKESTSLQIKEIEDAIKEKYENKIRTNISFEVTEENKFKCSLSLGFEHFSDHWFHFVSYEKKLDENFPVDLFAFGNKESFETAMNIDELENILVNIIKNEKTEILILSNLIII
jgi:hypothetical protein